MTVYKCIRCGKEFDDKYYLMHHNQLGLEEVLISHYKEHEKKDIIGSNYSKI